MQSRYLIARKSFQFSVLANFFIDGWDSNFLRRRRFFFSLKLFGEQFLIEGVGITFPFLRVCSCTTRGFCTILYSAKSYIPTSPLENQNPFHS